MALYTRKGDTGHSGLFGTDARLPKDSTIFWALGTLDELNSLLGLCRARAAKGGAGASSIAKALLEAQQCLFIAQAELAGSKKTIPQGKVAELEKTIDRFEAKISNPHAFVIPGATELAAQLDVARAVSRRAERTVVSAAAERPVGEHTKAYLNRLSSLLYVLARLSAQEGGAKEISPSY